MQTGFVVGMEEILGVTDKEKSLKSRNFSSVLTQSELGEDASQVDAQVDSERSNRARERYQRLFWEPVAEGQDPILPTNLERTRIEERKRSRAIEEAKAASAGIPPWKHEEHIVEVPGRPTWKFVDVGGKYVDVDDRLRRMKESERRSRLRSQRRARKDAIVKGHRDEKVAAFA